MGIIDVIKGTISVDDSIKLRTYMCQECQKQFESAKPPERAKCMECLSTDVELISEERQ